jgi:hypothetical protein
MVYNKKITFNNKQIEVIILINKPKDQQGYHYNIELITNERISGNEFQKLRKYLEDEGYVDEAESLQNF